MMRLFYWLKFRYDVWQVKRFTKKLHRARDENRRLRAQLGMRERDE